MTKQERDRQYRARKKAAARPAVLRHPLDLNPSDAANTVASLVHERCCRSVRSIG